MGPKAKPHEEVLNVCLAKILDRVLGKKSVVIAERAVPESHKRFDLKIDYRGIEFIIEASYDRVDATRDAKRRVEEGLIDTVAIALHYDPDKLSSVKTPREIESQLASSELELKVFSLGSDISNSLIRYTSGKIRIAKERTRDWVLARTDEFPQLLDSIVEFLVSEDVFVSLTEEIEHETNGFIRDVTETIDRLPKLGEMLTSNLYVALFSSSGKDEDAIMPDVPKDVILAHTYISMLMASILYDSVASGHGLDSMHRILTKKKGHPLLTMKEAFTSILQIDYEPVFDIAVTLIDYLFDLQTNLTVMQDLRDLIETVQHIVVNRAVLRTDFIGHIYHKITGNIATRKGYATFYTKAPIAYFLAYVALHSQESKWNDWKQIKVCDFACGSGTLLSASYAALQTLCRKACFEKQEQPNLVEFHKDALEDSIWGFDALEHAAQTASVVLSLHEPGVPLSEMRMYHVPVDGTGSQGSLNFWWANRQLVPIARRGIEKIVKEEVIIPSFDLVIMNPPFSRATAPGVEDSRPRIFDFVSSPAAFDRLWHAYTRLVRDIEKGSRKNKDINRLYKEYVGKNRLFINRNVDPLYAGAALPFFFLADRYVKKGGRIALVLPRTTLESSSFFLLRTALTSKYDIEYIVFSSEEDIPNFSYSAQLSEILLVARKTNKKEDLRKSKTCIVNFTRQPKDVLSGILTAKDVLAGTPKGGLGITRTQHAKVSIVSRKLMEEFVWNFAPILGLPPWIEKTIEQMVEGKMLGIPSKLCRIMDLPSVTVTNPRKFRGKQFDSKYYPSTSGKLKFLGKTGKKIVNRLKLNLSNTKAISPRNAKASLLYEECAGRLLVPEAIRFNTTPLMATWSVEPLISSRTHIIKANPKLEKALCSWMNSIFAIVWLRTIFTTLEQKFGHIYGWHIRILRIPDLTESAVVKELENVFNTYSETVWPSLPAQFQEARRGEDSTRLRYDLDIARALSTASGVAFDQDKTKVRLGALYSEISELV